MSGSRSENSDAAATGKRISSLPVVDFSRYSLPDGPQNIAADIKQATTQSGFFYLEKHGIPDTTIASIRQAQRRFFALPDEAKQGVAIDTNNRGYLASGKARMHGAKAHDQKEVFFWGAELPADHPDIRDQLPLCGANQWPDTMPDLRTAVLTYSNAIQELGEKLLACIALSLGTSQDFFTRFYQDSLIRGQLLHYPPTEGDQDQFGVAPHTDFGCITLLLQETAGLEVLIDDDWVAAPPIEGTLVINIGDLLERWTNHRLPSTRHRVRNNTGDERYSIAMFHDPSARAIIDPADLDPTIDTRRYEPVGAADYIIGRNRGAFAHYGEVAEKS
ncbi:MAG: isopenicillin N synthase family oxygenase [Gammaproteobacteria bacterium]|nr:isopenicillin N synthase family oxygenase [Gammaproteobacteria bacterium]